MKFRVIFQPTSPNAQSPVPVVEQTTGREVGWINRYLDREYVRRLADRSLRIYAYHRLHFVRGWESVHHTGDLVEADLAESTLLDDVRFQSSQQPRPSACTINDRVAVAERALRNQFPEAPCQIARGFQQAFLRRRPMGLGRPRVAMSRLRVKVPKLNIVPLSVNEVARFWSSFRTARDLAIVGLMLRQGLRSAEVLALNRDDVLLPEAQLRVRGKGNKLRFLPLAPETNGRFMCPSASSKPNVWSRWILLCRKSSNASLSFVPWTRSRPMDGSSPVPAPKTRWFVNSAITCIRSATRSASPPASSLISFAIPMPRRCCEPGLAFLS